MEKYGRAGQVTDDNMLRRMRIAYWITKATDTHLDYVILLFHENNGYSNVPQFYVCTIVAYLVIFDFNNLLVKRIRNCLSLFVENITALSSGLWSSVSPQFFFSPVVHIHPYAIYGLLGLLPRNHVRPPG